MWNIKSIIEQGYVFMNLIRMRAFNVYFWVSSPLVAVFSGGGGAG